MKNKLFKRLVCVALTAITLASGFCTTNVQAASKESKDYCLPKKHGIKQGVEYKASNYYDWGVLGTWKSGVNNLGVTLINKNSYHVEVTCRVDFYDKNGRKNYVESNPDFDTHTDKFYIASGERCIYINTNFANKWYEVKDYKVVYSVKKISEREYKKATKYCKGNTRHWGSYYECRLNNIQFSDFEKIDIGDVSISYLLSTSNYGDTEYSSKAGKIDKKKFTGKDITITDLFKDNKSIYIGFTTDKDAKYFDTCVSYYDKDGYYLGGLSHKCLMDDYSSSYYDDINANQSFIYGRDFSKGKDGKKVNPYSCDIRIKYDIKK